MIELLGWIAFIFGGAYFAAAAALIAMALRGGGLEDIPKIIGLVALAAIIWIAFAVWISPLSITFQ